MVRRIEPDEFADTHEADVLTVTDGRRRSSDQFHMSVDDASEQMGGRRDDVRSIRG